MCFLLSGDANIHAFICRINDKRSVLFFAILNQNTNTIRWWASRNVDYLKCGMVLTMVMMTRERPYTDPAVTAHRETDHTASN